MGALAVLLGWWCGRAFRTSLAQEPDLGAAEPLTRPRSWRSWALLFGLGLAWLAGVLYFNWEPFDFTTTLPPHAPRGPQRLSWLPLVEYYWESKYNALDQFLKKILSFLPLGVLAAFASRRLYSRRPVRPLLVAAFGVAAVIEAGQYFLPLRFLSTTDLLVECGGAWLGFLLAQHIRAVLWAEMTLYGFLNQFKKLGTPPASPPGDRPMLRCYPPL